MFNSLITGKFPFEDVKPLTSLQNILLSYNYFTGSLSQSIFTTTTFTYLHQFALSNNQLTGTLPSNIGISSPPIFTVFEIASNYTNLLSGTIPSWFGEMKRLNYFYINGNAFTGSIPSSIGNDTNLRVISFPIN